MALKAATAAGAEGPLLAFDDATGAVIDLDLRGSRADIRRPPRCRNGPNAARRRKAAAGPISASSPAR